MRLWLTVQPAFFASTADRPPLAEELLALGQLPDDLLRRVLALLHIVLSSFPMMGTRTRTTDGSAHGAPVTGPIRPWAGFCSATGWPSGGRRPPTCAARPPLAMRPTCACT